MEKYSNIYKKNIEIQRVREAVHKLLLQSGYTWGRSEPVFDPWQGQEVYRATFDPEEGRISRDLAIKKAWAKFLVKLRTLKGFEKLSERAYVNEEAGIVVWNPSISPTIGDSSDYIKMVITDPDYFKTDDWKREKEKWSS